MDDSLTELQNAARQHDDEALAALANKGLLRRAKKDIGASDTQYRGGGEFEFGGQVVTLRLPLTDSTCNCSAAGVCRHQIAVILWLREQGSDDGQSSEANPLDELAAIDHRALQSWCGKTLLGRALRSLGRGTKVEFDAENPTNFSIPTLNASVRWIAGGGLPGMLCSCHSDGACVHKVCAIAAYQVHLGTRKLTVDESVLSASSGAPRTRDEVVRSASGLAEEVVLLGFSRLTSDTVHRLQTLAVSAHGVDLPRLERLLKGAASEAQLMADLAAGSDPQRLLELLAATYALCAGLAGDDPRPELVGQHRGEYSAVGRLRIIGCGAEIWKTRTGYHGLTVYFWSPASNEWLTWSSARPVGVENFDPRSEFGAAGPWAGANTPEQAARSAIDLSDAYRSPDGRLSGRPATRALIVGESLRQLPTPDSDWGNVLQRLRSQLGNGLRQQRSGGFFALLQPADWFAPVFNPVTQTMARSIWDAAGNELTLEVDFTQSEDAASRLESLEPDENTQILVRLAPAGNSVRVEPITLWQKDKPTHFSFGSKADKSKQSTHDDNWLDAQEQDPLAALFDQCLENLVASAEGGAVTPARRCDEIEQLVSRLHGSGSERLANSLSDWVQCCQQIRKQANQDLRSAARSLLKSAFLLGIYTRAQMLNNLGRPSAS